MRKVNDNVHYPCSRGLAVPSSDARTFVSFVGFVCFASFVLMYLYLWSSRIIFTNIVNGNPGTAAARRGGVYNHSIGANHMTRWDTPPWTRSQCCGAWIPFLPHEFDAMQDFLQNVELKMYYHNLSVFRSSIGYPLSQSSPRSRTRFSLSILLLYYFTLAFSLSFSLCQSVIGEQGVLNGCVKMRQTIEFARTNSQISVIKNKQRCFCLLNN